MIEILTEDTQPIATDIAGLSKRIKLLESSWNSYERAYLKNKEEYIKHVSKLVAQRDMLVEGLDITKFDAVLNVLDYKGLAYISGNTKTGELSQFWKELERAVLMLEDKSSLLYTNYIGVKDYARWTCQVVKCPYGMGPAHGTVVAKIGLKPSVRLERIRSEVINDILYFIYKLKQGRISKDWLTLTEC